MFDKASRQTCKQLFEEFNKNPIDRKSERMIFKGVGNRDVYNITAPFKDEGELVIAGRTEKRDSEHSEVLFFINEKGYWKPREDSIKFKLQDPFISKIHGQLVFGGVEVFLHPQNCKLLSYRTVFYKGININSLKPFSKGPDGMKDIRLVELLDGQIGVFTRPQGEVGGRGKIGFIKIENLAQLSEDVINKAIILDDLFRADEWGGANELHILQDGLIGVLGHIARFDENGNRYYYPMVFKFNPDTMEHSSIRLIATRDNFLPGASKRPDLVNVVFSGGLIRNDNGTATLYAGISDAEAHKLVIPDPFI